MALVGPEVRRRLRVGEALSGRVNYGLHLRPGAGQPGVDQVAGR
jgi:hypothetical protein